MMPERTGGSPTYAYVGPFWPLSRVSAALYRRPAACLDWVAATHDRGHAASVLPLTRRSEYGHA
jgi:hypothetical protein